MSIDADFAPSPTFWDNVQRAIERISSDLDILTGRIGRADDGWLQLGGTSAEQRELTDAWRHLQQAKRELIECCRACDAMRL